MCDGCFISVVVSALRAFWMNEKRSLGFLDFFFFLLKAGRSWCFYEPGGENTQIWSEFKFDLLSSSSESVKRFSLSVWGGGRLKGGGRRQETPWTDVSPDGGREPADLLQDEALGVSFCLRGAALARSPSPPRTVSRLLVLSISSFRNLTQTKSGFSPPVSLPPELQLLAAAAALWCRRCSFRVNGIMQMVALLKRPFEVFNGDYGNGWAAQTFSRSKKRRHNDKKGAELQLLRGSSGWRVGPLIGSSMPGSTVLQQGVCFRTMQK